jgi:hypothetical protein
MLCVCVCVCQWDARKKKFVRQTVAEMGEGRGGKKRESCRKSSGATTGGCFGMPADLMSMPCPCVCARVRACMQAESSLLSRQV